MSWLSLAGTPAADVEIHVYSMASGLCAVTWPSLAGTPAADVEIHVYSMASGVLHLLDLSGVTFTLQYCSCFVLAVETNFLKLQCGFLSSGADCVK